MTMVFLSHSSADKELARRVAVELGMSNIQVWFDEWRILVGQSIVQAVGRGLDDADYVVVMLTTSSVQSGWVEKEWQSRVWDEATSREVYVLPLLCEDCERPRLLLDKRYADIRTNFSTGMRDLIGSIRALATNTKPVTAGARIAHGAVVIEKVAPRLPLMVGMVSAIQSGCFERHEGGLRAHIHLAPPHLAMQELGQKIGTDRMMLESSDFSISPDASVPTRFKAEQVFSLPAGDSITDVVSGRRVRLPQPMRGRASTEVAAHVAGGDVRGVFTQVVSFNLAGLQSLHVVGRFNATIAL
ncbi:MAG: toll/interleukin-1 receptor domain-containing protein [Planctomycetota bacterium]